MNSPDADDSPWMEDAHYTASESIVADQQVARLASRFSDQGYRDGIAAGKESALQRGFDQGFPLGAEGGRQLGRARGEVSAWLNYLTSLQQGQSNDLAALISDHRDLVRQLGKIKVDDVIGKDVEAEYHFRVEHDGLKPEQVLDVPDNITDELDNLLVAGDARGGPQSGMQAWRNALLRCEELRTRTTTFLAPAISPAQPQQS